jgi:hypothetical protein
MKKLTILSIAALLLLLGACAIPGLGPYASQVVDRFVNNRFTNPDDPKRAPNGSRYSKVAKGEPWLYRTEREGAGTRYYIRFDYDRCKYSLYVDESDIIRSWRDEGGQSPMNRCLLR